MTIHKAVQRKMVTAKTIVVNTKGMITIPSKIREKYNLRPGSEVTIIEIDGNLTIVPVTDPEDLRKADRATMARAYEKIKDQEAELEK